MAKVVDENAVQGVGTCGKEHCNHTYRARSQRRDSTHDTQAESADSDILNGATARSLKIKIKLNGVIAFLPAWNYMLRYSRRPDVVYRNCSYITELEQLHLLLNCTCITFFREKLHTSALDLAITLKPCTKLWQRCDLSPPI